MAIPVIDLFAGPGGLGEGFSSIYDDAGDRIFDIKLSIEKDEHAHETLRLRSFYRQFRREDVPDLYYSYIKENDMKEKNLLFEKLKKEFAREWEQACKESWNYELPFKVEENPDTKEKQGYTLKEIKRKHNKIDNRIRESLDGEDDWLLIGGPPCQAYSLVGRSRNQGIREKDHRVFLYKEYLRIIAKHHPAVFVMENVKGLLSAKLDGEKVFSWIKKDLRNPGTVFKKLNSPTYKVFSFVKEPDEYDKMDFPIYHNDSDFLIKTEKYGVPQRRHRVILLGIRKDIDFNEHETLIPSEEISLDEVIGSLPLLRSGIGRKIINKNEKGNHVYQKIKNTQSNWERVINAAGRRLNGLFPDFDIRELNFPQSQGNNFMGFELDEEANPLFEDWFRDERLEGVLNHETRTHLKEDLRRYLFSILYLQKNGDFPKLRDYPEWLLPEHKNAKEGKFADRFRTQKPNEPATTITSHISKDGHYFIHYDPAQCRSLTVREAARIQTFPDNYYFCGSRTHQYHQVGNAVPPFLAKQIAEVVKEILN
nr:DNA cytosine methyltransferase [uncultured Draconibacterium sp.]